MEDKSEESSENSKLQDENSTLKIQLKELGNVKDENVRLITRVEQVTAAHDSEMKLLNQQMVDAKAAQEKAEIKQAEIEITLDQYKSQSDCRINELIKEIEDLQLQLNTKQSDFNISKIPIKTEFTDYLYDAAETKAEQEKWKMTDQSQAIEIQILQSKLQSIAEEKDVLQTEHTEMSNQIMEYIDDLESMKSKLSAAEADLKLLRQNHVTDIEELQQVRSLNEDHSNSLTKQSEELRRLENENVELKVHLTEMTTACEHANAQSSEQEVMLCKLMTENSHLKERTAFLSDKLVVLEPLKAKNDMLISSIQEAESENVKLTEKFGNLCSKYDFLKHSFDTSQTTLSSKIVALSLVIGYLCDTDQQDRNLNKIDELKTSLAEMTANYASATNIITDLKDEIQILKSTSAEHNHILEKVIAEKLEIEEKFKTLEESFKNIETQAKLKQSQNPDDEFLVYLTSLLQQFESSVFCQLTLRNSLISKVETFVQLITFKNIKRSVDKFIKMGNLKLMDLNEQIDSSTNEIDETIQRLKNKASELEQKYAKQDSELENIDKLKAQFVDISVKYSSCIEDLNVAKTSLNELTIRNTILEEQTATLQEHESKLIVINEQQLVELKTVRENLLALEKQFQNLQTDYDASCLDTEKLQAIVDENRLVIEQTEYECRTMKASVMDCYDKIKGLMEETESLSTRNSSLSKEVKDLENAVEAKSSEILNLTDELEKQQQQNVKLETKIENEDKLLEKLQEMQEKHRMEIEEKQQNLNDFSAQFQSLKSDFSTNQKEMEIIVEQKLNLETEIENIRLQNDRKLSELSKSIEHEKLSLEREFHLAKEAQTVMKSDLLQKEQLLESNENLVASFQDQLR